jgi:sarcosine oxidase, subunit gamma
VTVSIGLPGVGGAVAAAPQPIAGALSAASSAGVAARHEYGGGAAVLAKVGARDRLGFKGPLAADWLTAQGVAVPGAPNRWNLGVTGAKTAAGAAVVTANENETGSSAATRDSAPASPHEEGYEHVLVARLGSSEFFMEDAPHGGVVARVSLALRARPAGVYPVLREDTALLLTGPGADAVLAQVCNVDFAAVSLESHMLIMTLMIGVAVLVVPQAVAGERGYRIWCDPSFGHYLGDTLGAVVLESGGLFKGVSI